MKMIFNSQALDGKCSVGFKYALQFHDGPFMHTQLLLLERYRYAHHELKALKYCQIYPSTVLRGGIMVEICSVGMHLAPARREILGVGA
jgi:hypothetical protein